MSISFKNVGVKTAAVNAARTTSSDDIPIGIMTPVRAGDGSDGIFMMHHDIEKQIHDNLANLLLTNRGDRVINVDLGANLLPLAMERLSKDDFDSEAMLRIKTTVDKYMPFIQLDEFESQFIDITQSDATGRIDVKVTYSIPKLNVDKRTVTVNFYLGA